MKWQNRRHLRLCWIRVFTAVDLGFIAKRHCFRSQLHRCRPAAGQEFIAQAVQAVAQLINVIYLFMLCRKPAFRALSPN